MRGGESSHQEQGALPECSDVVLVQGRCPAGHDLWRKTIGQRVFFPFPTHKKLLVFMTEEMRGNIPTCQYHTSVQWLPAFFSF